LNGLVIKSELMVAALKCVILLLISPLTVDLWHWSTLVRIL